MVQGCRTWNLRDEHGYIDLGDLKQFQDNFMNWDWKPKYVGQGGKPVELIPAPLKELTVTAAEYVPFANVYLLYRRHQIRQSGDGNILILSPNGIVESKATPREIRELMKENGLESYGNANNAQLTRAGFLWFVSSLYHKNFGVFLESSNGDFFKVIEGGPKNLYVSPDGCKVAYVFSSGKPATPSHKPWTTKWLEVVNLCKGEQ